MIDLSKLNDSERVFLNEYEIYNNSLNTLMNSDNLDFLKSGLKTVNEAYLNLIQHAVKLVKISDSTQLKLKNAQEKLKAQNLKIAEQNEELVKSNEVQEKLLHIINTDLSRAADYVKSILPPPIHDQDKKLNIDWRFTPSYKLGGDMFGYRMLDEDNIAVYLLDVCGHGIRSALYSVSVINAINYSSLIGVDFYKPASVFSGLNKIFNMRAHNDLFFTMWYGVFNLKTRLLHYSSAGHPPAIIVSNTDEVTLLQNSNFFVGGLPNYKFEESVCQLNHGDILYIFSDGAYEIRKSKTEYLTLEDLQEFLKIHNHNSEVLDQVFNYIQEVNYDETLEDDFSIMRLDIK